MGFADVDKKAGERYAPSKFLKKLAEKVGADIRNARSDDDVRRLVDEAKAKKPKEAETKPLSGEVLPPLRNGHDAGHVRPQLVFNLPSVTANIAASETPAWHEMVAEVKDAVLWMVLGAALMVVSMRVLGL